MKQRSPNPRLQRTRSAPLRSPLSRKPLGGRGRSRQLPRPTAVLLLLGVLALRAAGCTSAAAVSKATPSLDAYKEGAVLSGDPVAYQLYRDVGKGVEFYYPQSWQLVVGCDERSISPCDFVLHRPTDGEDVQDRDRSPHQGDVEIWLGAGPPEADLPTVPIAGSRSQGLYVQTGGERVNAADGRYVGWGDSVLAVLTNGTRSAWIHAFPPALGEEEELLVLVRSFAFTMTAPRK